MLRIHFTAADIARTCLVTSVDPLWEMVFSRLRLRKGDQGRSSVLTPWLRGVRDDADKLRPGLRVLSALTPPGPYFPDFLTPSEARAGLTAGLDAIRSTPRARVATEIRKLAVTAPVPGWARLLANGDGAVLEEVAEALRGYHRIAVEPYADLIDAAFEAELSRRSRTLVESGVQGLLGGMRPVMDWRPPVLHVRYTNDRDLHLRGRGLRLVPSFFCAGLPVALADPELPPTLVYPMRVDHLPARHSTHVPEALAGLLGATRSAVLVTIGNGAATTTELARRIGTSLSSISHHTAALRKAGLITTHRHHASVLHMATPLGTALLRANRE